MLCTWAVERVVDQMATCIVSCLSSTFFLIKSAYNITLRAYSRPRREGHSPDRGCV